MVQYTKIRILQTMVSGIPFCLGPWNQFGGQNTEGASIILPISWSHTPNATIVSETSNRPPNNTVGVSTVLPIIRPHITKAAIAPTRRPNHVGKYLGPYIYTRYYTYIHAYIHTYIHTYYLNQLGQPGVSVSSCTAMVVLITKRWVPEL